MNRIPSVELLNSTHQFPCFYTFKAIGKTEADFEKALRTVVQTAIGAAALPAFSSRTTPDGKHVSVTVELRVTSAEKVVGLYEKMLGTPGIVLLL